MKTLECYRIEEITQFGQDHGVIDKWPIVGSVSVNNCGEEGDRWLVYPRGTYHDDDIDAFIVRLVNENNPNFVIETIDPGFEREDLPSTQLPVHLVIRADNVNPIEAGQRAVLNGFEPWFEEEEVMAIVKLCSMVIMYDYTPPATPVCQ